MCKGVKSTEFVYIEECVLIWLKPCRDKNLLEDQCFKKKQIKSWRPWPRMFLATDIQSSSLANPDSDRDGEEYGESDLPNPEQ
ncbi:hypothetical protein J6590_009968 [Homalodisca vitripennis]|nr:hypothetical protein J6590_009968 [Homalodisca vitripennis]